LWRFIFAHIAFERETGIGFFENVPGWAGSPAEVALTVFLSINHVFISATTFGLSELTRIYRKIYVPEWLTNQPDTRPRRIITAIFWVSVKR
jgi:hypothetical protein